MGQLAQNPDTGEVFYIHDDGSIVPADNPGMMAFAGRRTASMGSGLQAAYGELTDQPELVNQANLDSAERNRLWAGYDENNPVTKMLGDAVPSLAAGVVTGGRSLTGQLAASAGVGAVESALDYDAGGDYLSRALAGGAAGVIGDIGGRVLGRVTRSVKGMVDDFRLGRNVADNPVAREAEELGLETLGSQRAMPDSQTQRSLQRLEQGAESSMFSQGLQSGVQESNQAVFREGVLKAIGLDPAEFTDLSPETLLAANRRISDGFTDVSMMVAERGGTLQIPDDLARSIKGTRGQISDLIARGRFAGLDNGVISGNEWNVARRALSQDAAQRAAKGEYEIADELFADVETLDRLIEERLPDNLLDDFARLREQYRVFKTVNRDGVVNPDGEVVIKSLNRRLRNDTGFGNTARLGTETTNPETAELINLARVGANPQLQPFRSSGTAENLSAQRVAGMVFDPTEWLSLAGEMAAPAATGVTSRGGGRAVTGLFTPSPPQFQRAGSLIGRSALDEALYPYVGIEDDREMITPPLRAP